MSWPLFPVLPPCSPNSQAPERRARCCSRHPPLGGARARLSEPRPSPLPLPVPLSPTAPAPGPRPPAPGPQPLAQWQPQQTALVPCRNLSAIQDREICCYSISCKEKDNIGGSGGVAALAGRGRRGRQPVALSLEPGAPWLSWAGQAAGSPDAEHHPSSAVNWCVIVGKSPLSLGLTPRL